jgi:hypothetical protein
MKTSTAEAISEFWRWWRGARARLDAAVAANDLDALSPEISARVGAIADGLGWEIGPGVRGAEHAFALSPGDGLAARRRAELWRAAAPEGDAAWEFHATKPGSDLSRLELEVAGEQIALDAIVIDADVDEGRERLDVRAFHPSFARVPAELAQEVTHLALVETLGEDAFARWLGDVEAVRAKPKDARPLASIREAIDALAQASTGDRFALLEGENDGRPAFALVNLACKPLDHLAFDVHLRVAIDVADATDAGLPTKDEMESLDAIEDDLLGAIGDAALFFAHETGSGKRVVHFFTDGDAKARAAVEEWRRVHAEDRAIAVSWKPDPEWEALARFS